MSAFSEGAVAPLWRGGPPERASVKAERARRRKIFLLQALVMAVAGAIFGMFYWIRPVPRVRFVPVSVVAPQNRLFPAVPMATPDVSFLAKGGYFAPATRVVVANQDHSGLVRELAALKDLWRSQPVVVYVRSEAAFALGGDPPDKPVDPKAAPRPRVLLVPSDAKPADPSSWLPLRAVIDAVKSCRSGQKLLVLDLSPLAPDSPLGLLDDDLPTRIREEFEAVPDSARYVLSSCAPGQRPFASDDIGRSVFNYYLEDGLRGWADTVTANGGPRDGIVSAQELGEFVRTRVDRWAKLNRGARQSPEWIGPPPTGDFPLVVLNRGKALPHLSLPKARTYPTWLTAGWKLRDAWRTDGSYRLSPRAFVRLEAALLRAERDWRGRVDPAQVQKDYAEQAAQCTRLIAEARARPIPAPRSVGFREANGATPDRALLTGLANLRRLWVAAGRSPSAATTQPEIVGSFLEQNKAKSDDDLAAAITEAIVSTPDLRAEELAMLSGLWQGRPRGPASIEANLLRKLVDLRPPLPAASIRQAIQVSRDSERAGGRPGSYPWVRKAMDEAAQTKHDAIIRLLSRGYVPEEDAARLLARASEQSYAILGAEDALEAARAELDIASILLPDIANRLDRLPQLESPWEAAVSAASELFDDLSLPPEGSAESIPSSFPDLAPRTDRLRKRTEALRSARRELETFGTGQVSELLSRSTANPGLPGTAADLEALLDTALPNATNRPTLWLAYQRLGRQLLESTLALDAQTRGAVTAASEEPDSEASDPVTEAQARAAGEARRSIRLLEMGGFGAGEGGALATLRTRLAEAVKSDDPALAWERLGALLRAAWLEEVPALISRQLRERRFSAADRLSRIVPPRYRVATIDDPVANPTARHRAQLEVPLWRWLADRYAYDARDFGDSALLEESARECRRVAGQVIPLPVVKFSRPSNEPALSPDRPNSAASVTLQVVAPQGEKPRLGLDVIRPSGAWLDVTPGVSEGPVGRRIPLPLGAGFPVSGEVSPVDAIDLPLSISLAAGDHAGQTVPAGFLLVATIDGRPYHTRIPVSFGAVEPWRVLVSDDPKGPTDPRDDIRLRPVKGRQSYFFYVSNPTDRPRRVFVELRTDRGPIPGASGIFPIEPNDTLRLDFPPPVAAAPAPAASPAPAAAPAPAAPKVESDLPELQGPIEAIIRDGVPEGLVLKSQKFDVHVASPTEYVAVIASLFQPARPITGDLAKNYLSVTLQGTQRLRGPACRVALTLPIEGIPGFLGTDEGNMVGTLSPDLKPLILSAKGIGLDETSPERGVFYIGVDAVPRALRFRNTFARRGSPTTPQLDLATHIRISALNAVATGDSFDVSVEIDNPVDDDQLEVSLGHEALSGFEAERTFPLRPSRRRRIGAEVLDGVLSFDASDGDWTIPIDTAGSQGRRVVRARLLDPNGRQRGGLVAYKPLILDDSTAKLVRIANPPARIKKGTVAVLRAVGQPSESGIKQVNFFLGRPVDQKRPAGSTPIEAQPEDNSRTSWTASVPLPADRSGPTEVSVEFVNGVGKSAFDTAKIDLTDADSPEPGKIEGDVLEGDRPQPELTVLLGLANDPKGTVIKQALTDPNGHFEITGIAPEKYIVFVRKPASTTEAQQTVEVPSNETVTVTLELLRKTPRPVAR